MFTKLFVHCGVRLSLMRDYWPVRPYSYPCGTQRGFIWDREADHYVIFTNRTSCMYCRYAKKNKIQLFEYKDYNRGLQPL